MHAIFVFPLSLVLPVFTMRTPQRLYAGTPAPSLSIIPTHSLHSPPPLPIDRKVPARGLILVIHVRLPLVSPSP